MPDSVRRNEAAIEMHAFNLSIGGDDLQCAAYRFDRGGIVSRADDDPLRGGEPLSDASDEPVLTAVGHCLRIQNRGATERPALPCGEVE